MNGSLSVFIARLAHIQKKQQQHNYCAAITIWRREAKKRNNEKYCSFAQTLESDEPIKLVAQIKTNYNV